MIKLNQSILSYIFSFIELEELSNILEAIKNLSNNDKDIIIRYMAVTRNNKFKVIKAKLNNYQRRCGKCYLPLQKDWSMVIGHQECDECLSFNNLNIEICSNCCKERTNKEIKRGNIQSEICEKCKMVILHLGINIFS